MKVSLQYIPKRYNVRPLTNTKLNGGRIAKIDTFISCCGDKIREDAIWTINKSIQSTEEASYGFAFVGLSELLKIPVIVKIMLNDPQGRREVKIQKFFRDHPHINIVQGICEFKCYDDLIKWKSEIKQPTNLCSNSENKERREIFIIIQEFIHRGDLEGHYEKINYNQWKSIFLQMLFAVLELFEKYGFFYDDWKIRNILLDETNKKKLEYYAFGKKWSVDNTFNLSPVFTDFSLCTFVSKTPEHLAYQISFCVDTFGRICPNKDIQILCEIFALNIENIQSFNVIIRNIEVFLDSIE
jgi:serine/threonine protein kinase